VKVPVDFGDGKLREVEVMHTFAGGREIYRSRIMTNPVTKKLCYVEYDPDENKVRVVEVSA